MKMLNISTFEENREILDRITSKKVILSLITCKFSDLRRYYKDKALNKQNLETKPLCGKVLFFENLKSLASGITSFSFPSLDSNISFSGIVEIEDKLWIATDSRITTISRNGEIDYIESMMDPKICTVG